MDKEIKENKFEVDTHEGKWFGQDVQSESTPMVDSGVGKPYILRVFEFGVNPEVAKQLKEKKIRATKQELFNYHWPQLQSLIWADGLIANRDVPPKVLVGKKKYRIFILCEPKGRSVVADTIQTLQDIFKK